MRTLIGFKNAGLIVLGILSAGFGLKGFLLSSHFIDGGVTGVSMLIAAASGWPLPILVFVINLPFVAVGYWQIGRSFALKSILAIAGLSLCIAFIHFPDVTNDKLLTAVFGGVFIGAGIGLAIRGGGVLDGTEIAALLISKKSELVQVGDVILGLNILIFGMAIVLLGIEPALYSILTYFSASKMVDFLIHGFEEFTAIIIITPKSEEVKQAIISVLNRGVTVFEGRGGMTDQPHEILYCVVTRLEIGRVKTITFDIDEDAFIVVNPLANAEGGVLKRTVLH